MPLHIGSSRVGHYDITALIGEDGMGEVCRARDTKLDRDVALGAALLASDPHHALIFPVGGAVWSTWYYWRGERADARVLGNLLIAVGAILTGNGGSFSRAGQMEVLYVAEFIGIILIYLGYRAVSPPVALGLIRFRRQVS